MVAPMAGVKTRDTRDPVAAPEVRIPNLDAPVGAQLCDDVALQPSHVSCLVSLSLLRYSPTSTPDIFSNAFTNA